MFPLCVVLSAVDVRGSDMNVSLVRSTECSGCEGF